jgi:hypothetical protein
MWPAAAMVARGADADLVGPPAAWHGAANDGKSSPVRNSAMEIASRMGKSQ